MPTVTDVSTSTIPVVGGQAGYEAVVKSFDFDSSYPTGGESLTASDLGLGSVVFVLAEPKAGYVFAYDYTNQKLLAYRGDNDAGADGPLVEVANGVNLSAVTGVRIFALGTPA